MIEPRTLPTGEAATGPATSPLNAAGPLVKLNAVRYRAPASPFELRVPRFQLERGEVVALTGPSGSGKTTLLGLIAGWLTAASGQIEVLNQNLAPLSESARESLRRRRMGIVFQDFRLIDYLTVFDNLALKAILDGRPLTRDDRAAIGELARSLRIEPLLKRYPAKISQGERQRVALGRAIFWQPELILADEPTGNLDHQTAIITLETLIQMARATSATLLVVTHDTSLLTRFDRHIEMAQLTTPDSV